MSKEIKPAELNPSKFFYGERNNDVFPMRSFTLIQSFNEMGRKTSIVHLVEYLGAEEENWNKNSRQISCGMMK